jgi:uncharacterized SAM-binding protein YcdF (DUF218 family)
MYLPTIILSIAIVLIFISLTLGQQYFISLNAYITVVIIGFISIAYHIWKDTFPIDLIITIIIGGILLHIKHRHLFKSNNSKLFLRRLYMIVIKLCIFILACTYISLIPLFFNFVFLWLAAVGFSALFALICYTVWSSSYADVSVKQHCDAILILGAGIFTEEVTPMLKDRLECALKLFQSNPTAQIIVSGGQGPDEPISEALAMQRYLIANGVPQHQIIMEDRSTSTYENIKYTKLLLINHISRNAKMICVTSQFHILRALRFGQKFNLKFKGLGSRTPYHFFEVALIRDYLALMYQYKAVLTIYFAALFILSFFALWSV